MVEGVVDEAGRALVPLTLRGLRSTVTAQAIIDTGFSGAVAVPIPIGVELGLEFMGTVDLVLADGTIRKGFVFRGIVPWGPGERVVPILVLPTEEVLQGAGRCQRR